MAGGPARKPRADRADDQAPDDSDRVELFRVAGVSYTVPSQPRANMAVRYLWYVKTFGVDIALLQLLEDLAGPAAIQALMRHEDLSYETLGQIFAGTRRMVLGKVELEGN